MMGRLKLIIQIACRVKEEARPMPLKSRLGEMVGLAAVVCGVIGKGRSPASMESMFGL